MFFGGGGIPFQQHQRGNTNVDTHALYKVLELEKSASQADIKKAFRRLALRKHPDKGGDPEEFKKIQAAYEVLSDPTKREKYDTFGLDGVSDTPQTHGDDIFEMFFGGSGMNRSRQRRKSPDSLHTLRVSLDDMYNGKTSKIAITRTVLKGDTKTCSTCNGKGYVSSVRKLGPGMIQQLQGQCPKCANGVISDTVKERTVLDITIDKGMPNKSKLRFKHMGNEYPNAETGDVVFVIEQIEHPHFKRRGNDLIIHKSITLLQALTGVSFAIRHLDGRKLRLKTSPGSIIHPPDSSTGTHIMCVDEEGMPQKDMPFEKGKLFIVFSIIFPKSNVLNSVHLETLQDVFGDAQSDHEDVDTHDEVENVFMNEYHAKATSTNDENANVQCPQS